MTDPQRPADASAPVMRDANGHALRVGDLVTVRVCGAWQKGWVRCIRPDPHHKDRVECLVTNGEQTDPKDELGTATFGAWIDKSRQIRWFRTPTPPLVALDQSRADVLRQAGVAAPQPHPPDSGVYGAEDARALLAGGWLDTISMHEYAPGLFALTNGNGDEVAVGLPESVARLFVAAPDLVRSVAHHATRADDAEAEVKRLRADLDRLESILRFDTPYPVHDVLTRLADATEHALTAHGCDRHGWEVDKAAAESARKIVQALVDYVPPTPTEVSSD